MVSRWLAAERKLSSLLLFQPVNLWTLLVGDGKHLMCCSTLHDTISWCSLFKTLALQSSRMSSCPESACCRSASHFCHNELHVQGWVCDFCTFGELIHQCREWGCFRKRLKVPETTFCADTPPHSQRNGSEKYIYIYLILTSDILYISYFSFRYISKQVWDYLLLTVNHRSALSFEIPTWRQVGGFFLIGKFAVDALFLCFAFVIYFYWSWKSWCVILHAHVYPKRVRTYFFSTIFVSPLNRLVHTDLLVSKLNVEGKIIKEGRRGKCWFSWCFFLTGAKLFIYLQAGMLFFLGNSHVLYKVWHIYIHNCLVSISSRDVCDWLRDWIPRVKRCFCKCVF